jgi:hypothetical protein
MRWFCRTAASILVVVAFAHVAPAQEAPVPTGPPADEAQRAPVLTPPPEGAYQRIVLRDSSALYGRIESIDADRVFIRTVAGALVDVARADVLEVTIVRGRLVGDEFRPDESNPTRLFFAPTGRTLRRGAGYIGVYEVFYPFVEFGVTDRVTLGGGTPLIFGGDIGAPFWFTPKVQVYRAERVQTAAGVIHVFGVGDKLGIAYVTTTVGTPDSAFTGGLGMGYANGNGSAPIVMLGGENRVSRRVKILTENWFWSGGGFVSGGVRFLGESLSADVSLVVPLVDAEYLIAFPIVNFVWSFGPR